MSRVRFPYALAVIAALVAVSVGLAACGGDSDRSDESPQAVLDEATLQGIESGNVDLSLGIKSPGPKGEDLDASLSGPFQGEGKGGLPQLDMTAKAKGSINGEKVDLEGGVALLPDGAYVSYEGVDYEVDPTTFSFVESILNPSEGGETGATGLTACQEELGKLKVGEFVKNGKNEGSAEVDGTGTTKISGDLEVSTALDALFEVAESQACRALVATITGPLPSKSENEKTKEEVSNGVKSAHVSVYVGDDDIVRRVKAKLDVERKNDGGGPKKAAIDFDLQLTGVNEEQTISAPGNAKPLGGLFIKLGINPIELLGVVQGEVGLSELLEGLGAFQLR